MYLEERINKLEKQIQILTDKVAHLEHEEKWVSAKELSEIMNCSVNNIYIRIRSGEIFASRQLGSPRIPLSQFYNKEEPEKLKSEKLRSDMDRVFEEK